MAGVSRGSGRFITALSLILSFVRQPFSHAYAPSRTLPDIKAAVIVPGFLTGASEFKSLAADLTARGIPAIAVPMPAWHWIPCIGGRSMRPMLERIDFAVRHLAAANGNVDAVPDFAYSLLDCWDDFRHNPGGVMEVGGSADPDHYPLVIPRGFFPQAEEPKGRVALIGHSAGGWISRLYLSRREYGGRAYGGQDLVHSLLTLGTPHGNAPGDAFRGVEWCNREAQYDGVRGLAVGGIGYPGDRSGELTKSAYAFCCPHGSDGAHYDGDGLTPIDSSLSWDGAKKLALEDVTHFPWSEVFGGDQFAPDLAKMHREGSPWYGSKQVLDQWAGWLDV